MRAQQLIALVLPAGVPGFLNALLCLLPRLCLRPTVGLRMGVLPGPVIALCTGLPFFFLAGRIMRKVSALLSQGSFVVS